MPSSGPQVNYFPYRPLGMLIRRQNLYAPRGKQRTGRREAQSREPVNKVKKTLCIYKELFFHIVTCTKYEVTRSVEQMGFIFQKHLY
jgi:hypothetical protein